jgi:hypothetical protein
MEVQHETAAGRLGVAFLSGGPAPETARRVPLGLRLSRDFAGLTSKGSYVPSWAFNRSTLRP